MADTVRDIDMMATATGLQDVLAARADEMDTVRRLPADLAAELAEAGLFRMVVPTVYGGLQLPARQICETIETLATANASAAWCVMIGATTALNAAYMDPGFAKEIYDDKHVITGGVFAPMGRAFEDGGDYIVSGRWQWGSGSANCTWLCGGALILEQGELKRLPTGRPDARMMIFPADDAVLHDTWHVAGLKGTGSGDISVTDIRVPKGRSVSLVTDRPKVDGALYAFPAFGLLALGVASVALGNARGALEAFKALARSKKPQGGSKTLAEKQVLQVELAKLEAALRSARAYLMDEIEAVWHVAETEGEIPVAMRGALRLACTHMVRTGADVSRSVYELGGGAALFLDNELQRRFRDAHAITQHIVTGPATYEQTGRLLFGLDDTSGMI